MTERKRPTMDELKAKAKEIEAAPLHCYVCGRKYLKTDSCNVGSPCPLAEGPGSELMRRLPQGRGWQ